MKRAKQPLKLKGVKRVTMRLADGTPEVYFYHRATMKRLDPDDLVQSFAAADKAMRSKIRGTFSDLIRNFDTSEFFKDLADATKESYLRRLKLLDAKWGSVPIEATQDKEFRRDVLAWHEQMGKRSRSNADNTVGAMARVLSYDKAKAVIDTNVLDTFERLYVSDPIAAKTSALNEMRKRLCLPQPNRFLTTGFTIVYETFDIRGLLSTQKLVASDC